MNHCFHISGRTGTHGNGERDDTGKNVRANTSSLPADGATPVVSRATQCIRVLTEVDSREEVNRPNANGFAGYLGIFEDTGKVINKIAHRGGTLDITGVSRCAHSASIGGDDPIIVL